MDYLLRRSFIKDYVNRSFRDVADKDYITARIAHRYELDQQFLWLALQSIEKYLKAILLYSGKSTKEIGHSIVKAYEEVLKISDIEWDFPEDIAGFVRYLNEEGNNRYFEFPYRKKETALLELDRTVWFIRRYCFNLRKTYKRQNGTTVDFFPIYIPIIQSEKTFANPNKYRLPEQGFIEVLLKGKSALRDHLVWNNPYYGTYKKKILRVCSMRTSFGNPAHFLLPEIFDDLDKVVRFSKPVRTYFKNRQKNNA